MSASGRITNFIICIKTNTRDALKCFRYITRSAFASFEFKQHGKCHN